MANKDSNLCLTQSPGWEGFDCEFAKAYCQSYAKDAMRCCPDTCGNVNSKAFTKTECQRNERMGTCKYPFLADKVDCNEGMKKLFEMPVIEFQIIALGF